MGARASTPAVTTDEPATSPRTRNPSADSSSSDVDSENGLDTSSLSGFRFFRAPSVFGTDRQRARSFSSVPDNRDGPSNSANISNSESRTELSVRSRRPQGSAGDELFMDGSINLGRVFAAHSLPAHIWNFNRKYTPPMAK